MTDFFFTKILVTGGNNYNNIFGVGSMTVGDKYCTTEILCRDIQKGVHPCEEEVETIELVQHLFPSNSVLAHYLITCIR